jgi:hypothetical protein
MLWFEHQLSSYQAPERFLMLAAVVRAIYKMKKSVIKNEGFKLQNTDFKFSFKYYVQISVE